MFDFTDNYKISRKAAAEGFILLKNQNGTLPFGKNDKIGIIGDNALNLIKGGGGSADVVSLYVCSLKDGLTEKEKCGKIKIAHKSFEIAKQKNSYSIEELNLIAEEADKVIVVIKRHAFEGMDRFLDGNRRSVNDGIDKPNGEIHVPPEMMARQKNEIGFYEPSETEKELFDNIEKSKIKSVVVILNIASTVNISYLDNYSKIKSVLLTYLPGMECGNAIADMLCGDVTPSGKLTSTIAKDYDDYPSAKYYNISQNVSEYKEDIFVGYRYFETFAKDKVLYPFGFGLSYTTFGFKLCGFKANDDNIEISVRVKNTGNLKGKEVVQIYSSSPDGKLKKPALELRAFAKTKELMPGEEQTMELSYKTADMASFDENGETGFQAAWVLEEGEYSVYFGNSVRNLSLCGKYKNNKTFVTEQLSIQFAPGRKYDYKSSAHDCSDAGIDKGITLYDVYNGKNSMRDFVRQMSAEELLHLAEGQFPDFAKGTASIGNLKKYGIPNPQTADGPAGLRKSVPTTAFPCPTLMASTWDKDIQFDIGKAMGYEGIQTGVDILLAPGLNIQRNPLCGRNFEYYSEDPFVSGCTAIAEVKGIQSQGLLATVKHFFANNCERDRLNNDSRISERAIREIYLRGFKMVVTKAEPAFVMSSYNLVNGIKCSTDKALLTNVLRGEWGFKGAVMTDWRNTSRLWEEIKAGNNIKMPFGYPEEAELALEKYKEGVLTRAELENNAVCVIDAVMKTNRFKSKNFGIYHNLSGAGENIIKVTETLGVSTTRVSVGVNDDKSSYFYMLAKDQRQYPTYILYGLNVEKSGEYKFKTRVKTDMPESKLWLSIDDELLTKIPCDNAVDKEKWYDVSGKISLPEGEHILKIMIVNFPDEKFEYHDGWYNPTEDLALGDIVLIGGEKE